jgi:2-polyprenyl-6-methoxyphenol hydroxylase-like FAD-dependent oxidoreductase
MHTIIAEGAFSVTQLTSFNDRHAVVIGASIAGLCAARVLADHFPRVTVIERDQLPLEPIFRPGVPQARHVHVMLARGQRILETLFPGLSKTLLEQGAVPLDLISDMYSRVITGWIKDRQPSELKIVTCSRILLEWQVRQQLAQWPQVQFQSGYEAVGLAMTPDHRAVTGVQVRRRDGTAPDANATEEIGADLVVDASGRDSRAPQWFEANGFSQPTAQIINSFLGYATCVFARPPDPSLKWKGMVIFTHPPDNLRGGVIWPIEGDRWMVVLGGANRDYPPIEMEGFMEFARTLPDPAIYTTIKDAAPLAPIYGYRRTENRLLHYERLSRRPENFVLIGDAVCAFNPVYGQGMSVAAMGAQMLDTCLRRWGKRDLAGFATVFQKELAKIITLPWQMATGSDLQIPGVEGGSIGRVDRLFHHYIDRIISIEPVSPRTQVIFNGVANLVRSPLALFHPVLLANALRRRPRQSIPL